MHRKQLAAATLLLLALSPLVSACSSDFFYDLSEELEDIGDEVNDDDGNWFENLLDDLGDRNGD